MDDCPCSHQILRIVYRRCAHAAVGVIGQLAHSGVKPFGIDIDIGSDLVLAVDILSRLAAQPPAHENFACLRGGGDFQLLEQVVVLAGVDIIRPVVVAVHADGGDSVGNGLPRCVETNRIGRHFLIVLYPCRRRLGPDVELHTLRRIAVRVGNTGSLQYIRHILLIFRPCCLRKTVNPVRLRLVHIELNVIFTSSIEERNVICLLSRFCLRAIPCFLMLLNGCADKGIPADCCDIGMTAAGRIGFRRTSILHIVYSNTRRNDITLSIPDFIAVFCTLGIVKNDVCQLNITIDASGFPAVILH